MSAYDKLTKAELIQFIQRLETRQRSQGSTSEFGALERERLLHDLQVHQAELEAQNEDLRRTQQLLEDSRDCYADLYDFAPVGYLTVDPKGLIQEINLTGAALLGVERARLVGMALSQSVAGDQVPKLIEHLRQCQQQEEGASTELRLNVAHRSPVVVQLVSVAVPDAQTGGRLLRTTMTDITQRTHAEQALAEHLKDVEFLSASAMRMLRPMPSGELFRYTAHELHAVAGRALVVVSEYDATTNQTRVQAVAGPDDKMRRLVPLVGQDPVGLAFTVAEGTLARMVRGSLVRVEGGLSDLTFQQLPLPVCHAIEQQLDLGDIYAMPFVHGDDFLGTVAILTDRAEGLNQREVIELFVNQAGLALKRIRADEHIRELNQDLRVRSTELEASNQELEAFVYSVSHDLRVPLNQIEQFSSVLRQGPGPQLSEETRRFLDFIHANAVAANRLAEDLLVLSQMDHRTPHKQPVAMRELAGQALAELQAEQNGRQVEITWGDLPAAEVDPVLLKQVWANLLSNAFKFTRLQPTPRIEIGSRQQDGEIIYWVKDNGAGFDMTQADRLFRVFQRLHHAEDFPGNGLGLAVVRRIIGRHGGRVWANAELDQGATFYFTLA